MSQYFSVFINFDGNCNEALDFYANAFGASVGKVMTYADMPPDPSFPVSDDLARKVMYADMKIAGTNVMFSDAPDDAEYKAGTNVVLTVSSDNEEDISKWYDELQVGGHVIMPLGETFFSKKYAMVADKFGICWNIIM